MAIFRFLALTSLLVSGGTIAGDEATTKAKKERDKLDEVWKAIEGKWQIVERHIGRLVEKVEDDYTVDIQRKGATYVFNGKSYGTVEFRLDVTKVPMRIDVVSDEKWKRIFRIEDGVLYTVQDGSGTYPEDFQITEYGRAIMVVHKRPKAKKE